MDIPELDNKGLRKFGIVTAVIVIVLFAFFVPWLFSRESMPVWPWVIAGTLVLPALLKPSLLRPVYRVWMRFGHVLGFINTRIILGILFFLLFLPMGLIMRMFKYDPMFRKRDQSATSYRVESAQVPKDRLEKPY